jgi:hypothetical protein
MSTVWTLAALGFAATVIAMVTAWRRGHAPENLGAVSDQWISEHRLGATQDSQR